MRELGPIRKLTLVSLLIPPSRNQTQATQPTPGRPSAKGQRCLWTTTTTYPWNWRTSCLHHRYSPLGHLAHPLHTEKNVSIVRTNANTRR
ncbi:hypothetical protein K439DRAFT_538638 [Ramaria rubella]|nr:hypothetical protein K439DRAFT_538638 [Ramaria rubella]